MVFYQTYRPQKIAELDSPKLRETLTAVLSSKNVPHAFLFTGPKGLGKTSTARIIAKILNCTAKKRDGIEPCNICEQCVSITNGTNIDVLEIDGASNRGIDEIRDLREKVNLAPVGAKKKVYIIDEVHMLTTEAFNALLKTIEEPPSHVVFIFATTEPQKVPATIISRCFHVSLSRATKEEILRALNRIAKQEKIAIDAEALEMIAGMADGGYRDGTKLLEEMLALSDGVKITKGLVEKKLEISGVQFSVQSFLTDLANKKAKDALEKISQQVEKGIDIKYFLSQCLEAFHEILLLQNNVLENSTFQVSPDMFTQLELQNLVNLFSKAYQETKYAVVPSLPLELAVVEWCQEASSDAKQSQSINIPAKVGIQEKSEAGSSVRSGMTIQSVLKKEQNLKVKQVLQGTVSAKKSQETTHTQEDLPENVNDNKQLLENFIYKVKPYNHSVAGVLRGCKVQSLTNDTLIFQTAYKFHKEKLEEQKIREILEQVAKEITGKQLHVVVELKQ